MAQGWLVICLHPPTQGASVVYVAQQPGPQESLGVLAIYAPRQSTHCRVQSLPGEEAEGKQGAGMMQVTGYLSPATPGCREAGVTCTALPCGAQGHQCLNCHLQHVH